MTDKKQAWTEEPWEVATNGLGETTIYDRDGNAVVASTEFWTIDEGDAARIVACVNALAGIVDPGEWRLLVTTAIEVRRWWLASPHDPQFQNAAMRKMVEAIDALLALQPPTEEETNDGR